MLVDDAPLCLPLQEQREGVHSASSEANMSERLLPSRSTCGPASTLKFQSKENWTPSNLYQETLAQCLLRGEPLAGGAKLLSYKPAPPQPAARCLDGSAALLACHGVAQRQATRRPARDVPRCPVKVLDAPGMVDDFYSHPIDWSSNDTLAVALANQTYLFHAQSGNVERLCRLAAGNITALRWTGEGGHLSIGSSTGEVLIWDAREFRQVRSLSTHRRRIGALAWFGGVLSSGSSDAEIHQHDVRMRDSLIVRRVEAHKDLVCGLDYSQDGQLASGGNDNTVCIWENATAATPSLVLSEHRAAVKALRWCPWQRNLLATGGGVADRKVCLWNTCRGRLIGSHDADSQVTGLLWGRSEKELLTAHGYSHNQVSLWKFPSLVKSPVKEVDLQGHSGRILGLAQSPDSGLICSASADETLRLWRIAEPPAKRRASPTFALRTIR